jgi:ribosomal protein L37AE/L43A
MICRDCLTLDCPQMGVVEFSGRYYCTDCFMEYCVMRESKVIWEGLGLGKKLLTNTKKPLHWFKRLLFKIFNRRKNKKD